MTCVDPEQSRDRATGRYTHEGHWDRLCRCGHKLGAHTAATVGGKRPCINHEVGDGTLCECERFRPAKRAARAQEVRT